jgi:hypothetical protein
MSDGVQTTHLIDENDPTKIVSVSELVNLGNAKIVLVHERAGSQTEITATTSSRELVSVTATGFDAAGNIEVRAETWVETVVSSTYFYDNYIELSLEYSINSGSWVVIKTIPSGSTYQRNYDRARDKRGVAGSLVLPAIQSTDTVVFRLVGKKTGATVTLNNRVTGFVGDSGQIEVTQYV